MLQDLSAPNCPSNTLAVSHTQKWQGFDATYRCVHKTNIDDQAWCKEDEENDYVYPSDLIENHDCNT
jgi:hypothetical protein